MLQVSFSRQLQKVHFKVQRENGEVYMNVRINNSFAIPKSAVSLKCIGRVITYLNLIFL